MGFQELETGENKSENFNISEIIERYLSQWKYILISIIVCLSLAFVYLRYSKPVYSSTATVLIKNSESKNAGPNLSALEGLGFNSGSKGLENEIEVFKSRTLVKKIVEKLQLNEEFYAVGDRSGIERAKLYKNGALLAQYSELDSSKLTLRFSLNIEILDANKIAVSIPGKKEINTELNTEIQLPFGKIKFIKNPLYTEKYIGLEYAYHISPLEKTITSLKKKLRVTAVNKDVDILSLTITGNVVEENNDFLNHLIEQHRTDAIKDKNQVAENTNTFLVNRLQLLERQLNSIEEKGKDFKKENSLTNVETDAQRFIEQKSEIESAITQSEIQLSLAKYMNEYIANFNENYTELLPANLGFEDIAINQMTSNYNELVLERNTLLQTSSTKNPMINKIDGELKSILVSLSTSLKNLQSRTKLEIEILKKQDYSYQSKISQLPQFELDYRGILRQQEIKESLYLFLLKKKEENEISMAANESNTKTIDLAYSDKIPVSPKRKIIYLGAFLLAILIPAGIIYLKDLLDTKLKSPEDIEDLNLPLAGAIPVSKEDEKLVSKTNLRSPTAEAYRILRTNINFLLNKNKEEGNIIYITSTIAGEGKTLTSLNMARSLAFTDKKVLLVGLDLRKPKLFEYLGITQGKGMSDYLANHDLDINDLLLQSQEFSNLQYISSGSIPPNPSELLLQKRLADLFEQLKEEYDYILVDTAPASLVTDTPSISKYADLTLYVARANFLDKRLLKIPYNFYKKKSLGEMAILVNAVKSNGSRNYGYSYGYGEDVKQSFFSKLFKRKK